MSTAVILRFGRPSLGEMRRVESWQALLDAAGAAPQVWTLVPGGTPRLRHRPDVGAALRREIVPDAMAWSAGRVASDLWRVEPDVVVCVTARAFHPRVAAGPWHTVLDYVDRLSDSYRQRADAGSGLGSYALRKLSRSWATFENASSRNGLTYTAAGWRDAKVLGVEWVPNLITEVIPAASAPDRFDVVFFGSLDYAPNVLAVERLRRIVAVMPEKPSVLVAGRNPTSRVHDVINAAGWTLWEDFRDVRQLAEVARVAVAPLPVATGIQNKVLEAAAAGMPQVASPAALAGLAPGFPVRVTATNAEFAAEISGLLADPAARVAAADAARDAVLAGYTVAAWSEWSAGLLRRSPACVPAPPSPARQ